jgi:IS605 OrfB family transposase
VSLDEPKVAVTTDAKAGVFGVDLNADHLAWAELDRFGNPVATGNIPCVTYGETTEQAAAMIERAAMTLVNRAKQAGKSLVLESLDFSRKKGQISEVDGSLYARILSGLSYRKTHTAISVRAAKDGGVVKRVNPAYTSVLGRWHWADRYGLTVHEGVQ